MSIREIDRNGVEAGVEINRKTVQLWLEAAGRALLSLPGGGFSPRLQSGGLDVVRNFAESYGWSEIELKPPRPSPAQIDLMDKRLQWMRFIPDDRYVLRRIVGARMLVHPIREKHLYSWRRLGQVLGCDHKAIQRWHVEGIDFIVSGLTVENIFHNPFPSAPEICL